MVLMVALSLTRKLNVWVLVGPTMPSGDLRVNRAKYDISLGVMFIARTSGA